MTSLRRALIGEVEVTTPPRARVARGVREKTRRRFLTTGETVPSRKVVRRGRQKPSRRRLRRLFDCWPRVARRVHAARHLALFLDFDGTLVRMRRRPEEVRLDDSVRRLLGRLARHPRITLCFISGRRRADLRRRVRVQGARYLGLHGWEQSRGGAAALDMKLFNQAQWLIKQRVRGLRGIRVEDKGLSLVVHYRGASGGAARRAGAITREVLELLSPELRLLPGKKIREVLPRAVEGKGAAVRRVLAGLPRPVLPIYVGDDTTDEPAFEALRRGLTVRVGSSRRTAANFFVRNPAEVASFLRKLEGEIR